MSKFCERMEFLYLPDGIIIYGIATEEDSLPVSFKVEHAITIWPNSSTTVPVLQVFTQERYKLMFTQKPVPE